MAITLLSAFLVLVNIFYPNFSAEAVSPPRYAIPAHNVALQGITSQSSTNSYYGSSKNANDGSLANNYLRSQCSYTKKDPHPWWIVDLREPHQVFSVAITNRVLECCRERIFGAEIRIGNDPSKGGTLNPRCGVIKSIESGETLSFSCQGMIGQYVTVTIPEREEHLVLCEVQVFGRPVSRSDVAEAQAPTEFKTPNGVPNIALKGISQQSSIYNMYGESKNAIDGSLSSNYLFIECAGTGEQDDPWWMVNLQSRHKIFTVAVTNRGDCCSHSIAGAQIRIGNSPEQGGTQNPICGIIESMDNGETLAFECNGMEGQYVTVFIPGHQKSVTICEVQVFGLPSETPDEISLYEGLVPQFNFTEDRIPFFESDEKDYYDTSDSIFDFLFDDKPVSDVPEDGVNLAFRGITSQSSTYDKFGNSANAIDGSKNTRYMSGHCSHTDLDIEPWWRVDLTDVYNVTKVKIMNRGDCCNIRIKGAEIRIGNSQEKGGTKNPRCAKIASMDLGEEETYICGMVGRYVTVTIPGKAAYLTLCEVKVFGHQFTGNYTDVSISPEDSEEAHAAAELYNILKHSNAAPNIALRGDTSQSSTDENGESKYAVHGSLLPTSQCAKTKEELSPSWTLDLKTVQKVFSIAITNQGDCCAESLDGAEIHVGNSAAGWKKNLICGTVSSIGLGETFSFNCDGMEGRYVTIVIPDKVTSLTLCEVQVFGLSVDTPSGDWNGNLELQKKNHGAKNMAPQGFPSQSSNYGGKKTLKAANDGSLSSNYMADECIHTQKSFQPWWRLNLKSRMQVHSIAITNREDCCRERINGAEIRIGDSEENGGISNPRCAVVFRMGYGETLSFDCKGMEGQYVTVTIPDRMEYLTICEVQVFADPLDIPQGELIPLNTSETGEY
ncbi:uncharacterized protein O3C94_013875 [Discoglossus pictus]